MFLKFIFIVLLFVISGFAERGYYDAPYKRYEADQGQIKNAEITKKSYAQVDVQSEASQQVCINFSNEDASVEWKINENVRGLVLRYSVPDNETATVSVYVNDEKMGTLNLTSNWSWEYLWNNGNPNNNGIVNTNPRMRFDEVRLLLQNDVISGSQLKLVRENGNMYLDFIELEPVKEAESAPDEAVAYYGDGSTLQAFIDANGGKTIFLPPGIYNVSRELYFGSPNTTLKGAGIWYSQIHFTNNNELQGGLRSNASNVSFSDLYLTTVRNSRSNSYKAINGIYSGGATINNIWAEHFECGAWIGQYNNGVIDYADGLVVSNCRFRNNYADGINLCKGTRNSIVEHCNFRNNGDDDMAIWSANDLECQNNTFRYNTSEHCWRASGCAIYGGYNNRAHNLLIRDNLEAGIRVNNTFPGVGFSDNGIHEFYDISIISCGTFNSIYNNQVGAIDLFVNDVAGTKIKNVKFSDIDIIDSKNDAIFINKGNGEGFYNLVFEDIRISGTGKEYPYNNVTNKSWGRGYGILFSNYPSGNGTYENMSYSDIAGNVTTEVNISAIGSFEWSELGVTNLIHKDKHCKLKLTLIKNINNLNIHIPLAGIYSICIYDLKGKKVTSFKDHYKKAGKYKVLTNIKNSKGIYLLKVKGSGYSLINKITLY